MSATAKLQLLEPRLQALFDIYLHAAELRERMLAAVVFPGPALSRQSDPAVNTREYSKLLMGVGVLSNVASQLMNMAIELRRSQPEAYEAFSNAVEEWGTPIPDSPSPASSSPDTSVPGTGPPA